MVHFHIFVLSQASNLVFCKTCDVLGDENIALTFISTGENADIFNQSNISLSRVNRMFTLRQLAVSMMSL